MLLTPVDPADKKSGPSVSRESMLNAFHPGSTLLPLLSNALSTSFFRFRTASVSPAELLSLKTIALTRKGIPVMKLPIRTSIVKSALGPATGPVSSEMLTTLYLSASFSLPDSTV